MSFPVIYYRMKKKTERYGFNFDVKTSELIKRIAEQTDLNYTKIVQRGVELFAKEKGVEA